MKIGDKIKNTRKKAKLTQEDIARLLGVDRVTVSKYESGAIDIPVSRLENLADALGVSIVELLGVDDDFEITVRYDDKTSFSTGRKPEQNLTLSPAEQTHIKKYRALDEHGKTVVDLVVNEETSRMEREKQKAAPQPEKPKTKVIPLFLTPAAAGYVSPALGEDYEDYTVPADSQADFACKIQGDSMEPVIPDGSVVLVKRQIDMVPGDVGLFYVDGHMKCKQYCEDHYGNIYLFSLNRERRDADQTILASSGISVYCFGKVILKKRPPLPRI